MSDQPTTEPIAAERQSIGVRAALSAMGQGTKDRICGIKVWRDGPAVWNLWSPDHRNDVVPSHAGLPLEQAIALIGEWRPNRCECLRLVNEQIAAQHMRLIMATPITKDLALMEQRVTIAVERTDRRRKPQPILQASYCPFCGRKYINEGGQ